MSTPINSVPSSFTKVDRGTKNAIEEQNPSYTDTQLGVFPNEKSSSLANLRLRRSAGQIDRIASRDELQIMTSNDKKELKQAIQNGDVAKIEQFRTERKKITEVIQNGSHEFTWLHYAAVEGSPTTFKKILNLYTEQCGDLNARDSQGKAPIHRLLDYTFRSVDHKQLFRESSRPEHVRFQQGLAKLITLLEKGADPNIPSKVNDGSDYKTDYPLSVLINNRAPLNFYKVLLTSGADPHRSRYPNQMDRGYRPNHTPFSMVDDDGAFGNANNNHLAAKLLMNAAESRYGRPAKMLSVQALEQAAQNPLVDEETRGQLIQLIAHIRRHSTDLEWNSNTGSMIPYFLPINSEPAIAETPDDEWVS